MLRKHQSDFADIIDSIISGSGVHNILVHVVPGGGKSAIPIIAGKLITAGLADALCWVAPRKSLQDQGERNFADPFFRQMLGHNLTIRSSTNELDPCRGLNGFITTYQALGVDEKRTVLRDFSTKRYILILDENHHVDRDPNRDSWYKALEGLVKNAAYLVLMTGTLERGDQKPIAWVEYGDNGKPVMAPSDTTAVIRYTRTDALREKAILPIAFSLYDGQVEWEKNGVRKSGVLSECVLDAGQAIFTALSTDFADMLLDKGIRHWQAHKASHLSAKLLVVTADFEHAKKVTARLKAKGLYVKIATSHDSPTALRNIKEFKYGKLDILVSIAMAYEGLDVPQISHIVSLTRIRSVPWIEQMISRAVRIDPHAGPYETQQAYVFAPDDSLFCAVVERIRSEQVGVVMEPDTGTKRERGKGNGKEPDVIPLGSMITGERSFSIGSYQDPLDIPPQTPTDLERELREKIESHVHKYSFKYYYKIQRINAEIKKAFGKARAEMTLPELRNVLAFVQDAYPLAGQSLVSGVSGPRGKGRRTSAKAVEVEPPKQASLWG